MAFSSVAIVAGVTALTSSLFKDKELRVKDVIELSKLDKECIESHPHLKIVKNDINAHITGVKDPIYHEALIEIMAKYNKPVGYFSKLDRRLNYSEPCQISIVKLGLFGRLKNELMDMNSSFASFAYLSFLLFLFQLAIEMDASSVIWMQAAAIILAGLSGIVFSQFLTGLSVQWSKNFHKVKDCEYESIFDEYKNNKMNSLELSKENIIRDE